MSRPPPNTAQRAVTGNPRVLLTLAAQEEWGAAEVRHRPPLTLMSDTSSITQCMLAFRMICRLFNTYKLADS